MKINVNDPFEGLDDEAEISHGDGLLGGALADAAARVFAGGDTEGDTDTVLVGEPGDGADIDADTFEPVTAKGRALNADDGSKSIPPAQPLTPWTDEELDAMSTVTAEDVKRSLGTRTPEMQALLRAKEDTAEQ